MEENKDLVTEDVAENTEETVEETPKVYTEEEFNSKLDEVLGKKIARKEARIRKEYEKKYGNLEEVLRAGTGKKSVDEITEEFTEFYKKQGVNIPDKPKYTDRDIKALAKADADEIISSGYDDVAEEVERLAKIGAENMTDREKACYKVLAEHMNEVERHRELTKIGVTDDVYNSKEFKEFASKFNSQTPIADVYNIYTKTLPKKEIKPMGSMANSDSTDDGVKEFYTPDEARKFTRKELDDNPKLFNALIKSMYKWN